MLKSTSRHGWLSAGIAALVLCSAGRVDLAAQNAVPADAPHEAGMADLRPMEDVRLFEAAPLDSVRLRYNLVPHQQITYRVVTLDSMLVPGKGDDQHLVTRQRVEVIHFRCDTILPQGIVITEVLKEYVATERMDSLPPVTRTTHPWVGRVISFLMSPDGRRVDMLRYSKENGVRPGAPFQPSPMPFIGPDSTFVGASGMFNYEQFDFDNAFPPPFLTSSIFRTVQARVDTLGEKTIRLSLSETGQMKYYPPPAKNQDSLSLYVHTVITGSGNYYYAPERGLMIAGDEQMIGRVTIMSTKNTENKSQGRQIIRMSFTEMKEE